jgi:hypothetical protein
MVDEPENLTLKQLALLRSEMQAGFEVINSKIGALAGSLVGITRDIHGLQRDVSSLKDNVAVLAVAVDEHTHRLDRIEKRLGLVEA